MHRQSLQPILMTILAVHLMTIVPYKMTVTISSTTTTLMVLALQYVVGNLVACGTQSAESANDIDYAIYHLEVRQSWMPIS